MVRIARRVPVARDAEVAALAPLLSITQLDRLLRSVPDQPAGDGESRPEPERMCRLRQRPNGWLRGEFCLPPDEAVVVDAGRTGQPGDRHHVVLHHDVDRTPPGPRTTRAWRGRARCHRPLPGPRCHRACLHVPAGPARGIRPAQRTPNPALRRYLARRDQGCAHPLCTRRRWLHAHHIVRWEDGGPTVAANLALLCPYHHRALQTGEFRIEGDPEAGNLRFLDRFGRPIAPPPPRPPGEPPPDDPPTAYTPPLAERLSSHSFTWN